MNQHCDNCPQKGNLYSQILKARKLKLQKEKRLLDKMLKDKLLNVLETTPRGIDDLDHYSDSQFSINGNDESVLISRKHGQKQQIQLGMSKQELLKEKAKRFVMRLKKQKEYNEGKLLLMRKRQQQQRQIEQKRMNLKRKSLQYETKRMKMNQLMNNILTHEEKISSRAIETMNKLRRSKVRSHTQNTQREVSKSQNIQKQKDDKQIILSLRKRVKQLSEMIGSYSP